jgi:hypothetical protein
VKQLNKIGFQTVLLPQSNVMPPELYNWSRPTLIRRGPLQDYLPEVGELQIERSYRSDIESWQTSIKKRIGSASFLKNALMCLGYDASPKLDLSFTGSSELIFRLSGITSEGVDSSKLTRLVQRMEGGSLPEEFVNSGRLCVAYEYLYATKVLVSRSDRQSFDKRLTAAVVAQYLGLGEKGAVTVDGNRTMEISRNNRRAAFALKCGYLKREDEGWRLYPEEKGASAQAASTPTLLAAGHVIAAAGWHRRS